MKSILAYLIIGGAVASTDLSFRRDSALDEKIYPEGKWAPYPQEGGRIHFVSSVTANLELVYPLNVNFGSFNVTIDPIYNEIPTNGLDWCHSQYNRDTGSLFTSMHSHKDDLIKSITNIKVTDSSGQIIVDDPVEFNDLSSPDVQVTYVTTSNNFRDLVVHIHNYGSQDFSLDEISINSGAIAFTNIINLKSSEHVVKLFDVSALSFHETSVWTVSLRYNGTSRCGYGGRLNKELFPVEDWPKSSQCPYPIAGANTDNFQLLKDELHVNTHFLGGSCEANPTDIFVAAAQSQGEWFVLPSEGYSLNGVGLIPDDGYAGVAAVFVGDESDSGLEETWDVWRKVLTAQTNTGNKYAIYDGGHSNHLNGAYSGLSDIQGMDFYVAGCAPHITLWTSDMRLQGSFDYLFNTRQNHKPLTTWLYSQGWCADCWNVKNLDTGELVVQLASVLAAGGKGMMLFQSDVTLQGSESWVGGGAYLASIALISERLRVSDVEGAQFSTSANLATEAIMQTLALPDGLIFVAINTIASGYNDKTCLVSGKHWVFDEQVVDSITVEIPPYLRSLADDAGYPVSQFFKFSEVIDGVISDIEQLAEVDMSLDDHQGTWSINHLKLGTERNVSRIFLLIPV